MGNGWIKLHRQLQEHWLWQSSEPFDKRSAWIDLLMSAMHSDTKKMKNNHLETIERGTYKTSIGRLAKRWKWSKGKVDRFLNVLETEHMVNAKRNTDGALITIVKYDVFQGQENAFDTPNDTTDRIPNSTPDDTPNRSTNDTTGGTPNELPNGTHNKNDKNVNNINNIQECKEDKECKEVKKDKPKRKTQKAYYPNDEKLNQAFVEFVKMRKEIKKPLTSNVGIKRAMNRLEELAGDDNDLAIQIIEQSIFHCWQTFYELKDSQGKNNYKGNQNGRQYGQSRDEQFERLMQQIKEDEASDS